MSTQTKLTVRQIKQFLHENQVKFDENNCCKEYLFKVYSHFLVNDHHLVENICEINHENIVENTINKKRYRNSGMFTRSQCRSGINDISFVKKNICFDDEHKIVKTRPLNLKKKIDFSMTDISLKSYKNNRIDSKKCLDSHLKDSYKNLKEELNFAINEVDEKDVNENLIESHSKTTFEENSINTNFQMNLRSSTKLRNNESLKNIDRSLKRNKPHTIKKSANKKNGLKADINEKLMKNNSKRKNNVKSNHSTLNKSSKKSFYEKGNSEYFSVLPNVFETTSNTLLKLENNDKVNKSGCKQKKQKDISEIYEKVNNIMTELFKKNKNKSVENLISKDKPQIKYEEIKSDKFENQAYEVLNEVCFNNENINQQFDNSNIKITSVQSKENSCDKIEDSYLETILKDSIKEENKKQKNLDEINNNDFIVRTPERFINQRKLSNDEIDAPRISNAVPQSILKSDYEMEFNNEELDQINFDEKALIFSETKNIEEFNANKYHQFEKNNPFNPFDRNKHTEEILKIDSIDQDVFMKTESKQFINRELSENDDKCEETVNAENVTNSSFEIRQQDNSGKRGISEDPNFDDKELNKTHNLKTDCSDFEKDPHHILPYSHDNVLDKIPECDPNDSSSLKENESNNKNFSTDRINLSGKIKIVKLNFNPSKKFPILLSTHKKFSYLKQSEKNLNNIADEHYLKKSNLIHDSLKNREIISPGLLEKKSNINIFEKYTNSKKEGQTYVNRTITPYNPYQISSVALLGLAFVLTSVLYTNKFGRDYRATALMTTVAVAFTFTLMNQLLKQC